MGKKASAPFKISVENEQEILYAKILNCYNTSI